MGTYVTVADVRRTSGILVTEISDVDVEAIITECEPQIERFYNTTFTPKERIDILDGNGTYRIILDKNPLLAVREIKIDGETEDPASLLVFRESGKVELGSESTNRTFKEGSQKVVVKYIYGFVEETSTVTTTSLAEIAGTNVSVEVGSITGLLDNDWVEIYGMDGHKEAAQINGTPALNTIILDKLVFTHEAGSTVVKLTITETMKKLINLACSIACVARLIGQSYTDTVGYGLGELNIQKGEPYTQWRETASQMIAERDQLMSNIKPRPYIC
jgi:ribosomal protein L30E